MGRLHGEWHLLSLFGVTIITYLGAGNRPRYVSSGCSAPRRWPSALSKASPRLPRPLPMVFAGALSDRLGRRKLLAAIGYGLAAFTKPVFPLTPVLAPRLLVAFGEQRERYGSAAEVQQYSGIAPVVERSGNKCWTHWRLACPRRPSLGLQMDPDPLSLLAEPHSLGRSDLLECAAATRIAFAQNRLTDCLRA